MIGPFEIAWLLLGLAAPVLIGVAAAWLSGIRRQPGKPQPYWAGAVLVIGAALASAVGIMALLGLPPWRPIEGSHWLIMAVLPAALVVALLSLFRHAAATTLAWSARIAISVGVAPLLTRPLIPYTWTQNQATLWWVGVGVVGCIGWFLARRFALLHGGRLMLFILGGTCGILAGITMASGYLAGGQFAASPALALAGAWLILLIRGADDRSAAALTDLAFPLLLGMLIYNWQFGWRMQHDWAPFAVAVLLAAAPFGVWIARLPALKSGSPRLRTIAAVTLIGLFLAAASGLAGYEAMQRAQADSGYEYDY